MRNKVTATSTMVRLLENVRYEVLPTASIEATVLEHVSTDQVVTVSTGRGRECQTSAATAATSRTAKTIRSRNFTRPD